jgi:hypothetical protein
MVEFTVARPGANLQKLTLPELSNEDKSLGQIGRL